MRIFYTTLRFRILLFFISIIGLRIEAQIPSGYYNSAEGKDGYELKTALHLIIKDHTDIGYDAVWNAFKTTDKKANGKVWDMYSDNPAGAQFYEYSFGTNQCGNYSAEGSCYNREHSFPKSWFNDGRPMHNDLFHLYPTDGTVNGIRSNFPFGEVKNATKTTKNGSKLGNNSTTGYTGTVFEPIDEYKGDFARTYLYMATRYEDKIAGFNNSIILDGSNYKVYKDWHLKLLFKWMEQDPVSQKEIDRNNAVYKIQHNRNPFIDHPEYAYNIWKGYGNVNPTDPETTVTLLHEKFNAELGLFSQYNIQGDEVWRNNSYGGENFAEMNGFSGGSAKPNEDWLISPKIDLKSYYKNIYLSFKTGQKFGNDQTTQLKVYVLENYQTGQDPRLSGVIKSDITTKFSYSAGNYDWKESGQFDLLQFKNKEIHIAFVYVTTSEARLWRVDDVVVSAIKTTTSSGEVLKPKIKIYPNPASEVLTIVNESNMPFTLNIYNTVGAKVLSENEPKSGIRLDISNLTKGVYIIELKHENDITTHTKLIKR